MDHPIVKQIQMYGYPLESREPKLVAIDALDNEVYEGDEVYELGNDIYLVEALSWDAKEILEKCGAIRYVAEK